MTGLELARKHGARVARGPADCYRWDLRTVVLTIPVILGSDAHSLYVAAHEAAHHQQHEAWPWVMWLRIFEPFRWWLEADAGRRAVAMLAAV